MCVCVCKSDCVRAYVLLSYYSFSFDFVFLPLFVFCLFVVAFFGTSGDIHFWTSEFIVCLYVYTQATTVGYLRVWLPSDIRMEL